jgi:voltage-gated potassium channel
MASDRKHRIYEIIFEAETGIGKAFDIGLLLAILGSIAVVMLESVAEIRRDWGQDLLTLEWIFTGLFTAEYAVRLYCVRRPLRYALSFFGIVDLLAILPTYASLFVVGAQSLVVIRALRLLRIFRVFKLARFLGEANVLLRAMKGSSHKLGVFVVAVVTIVLIIGTAMYSIEGNENPEFTNIPACVYWAIVTVTTVGYGDAVPVTVAGKFLASILMVTGFGIIAVPTGIFAAELVHHSKKAVTTEVCPACLAEGHDPDAAHWK